MFTILGSSLYIIFVYITENKIIENTLFKKKMLLLDFHIITMYFYEL